MATLMAAAPPSVAVTSDSEGAEKCLVPSIQKCVDSSLLLQAHAARYSDGVETLVGELQGIHQELTQVMDAFTGPSLASQLMAADDAAAAGGQTTPLSESRRGLRGQRKPGAQLLWGGGGGQGAPPSTVGVEEEAGARDAAAIGGGPIGSASEGCQEAGAVDCEAEMADGDGELAGEGEELKGESIMVLLPQETPAPDDPSAALDALDAEAVLAEGPGGVGAKGAGDGDSRSASRAATRPQTMAQQQEAAFGADGAKAATRPQTRDESVSEEGGGGQRQHAIGEGGEVVGASEERGSTVGDLSVQGATRHEDQPAAEVLSDESLREYEEGREELIGFLREQTADSLSARKQGIPCGLRNQGATCYLNSLLQALYQVPELRSFALSWQPGETDGGGAGVPESLSIPAQLRMLFSSMTSSHRAAVSTQALTSSFGWGSAAAFQQHDCSELLLILFEAMGKASNGKFEAVRSMLQGVNVSYIGSEERGVWRGRDETFLGLQLQVEGIDSVQEAVKAYVQPEVLDGDNKWRLDDGSMVPAVKGLFPKSLPPILVLDLKRFTYGAAGREKVESPQSIALELNMGEMLRQWRPAHVDNVIGEGAASSEAEGLYDIQAVLLHRGTAMGGHYTVVLREWQEGGGLGRWLHCNDDVVSEVEEGDVQMLLESGSLGAERRTGVKYVRESTAYMLFYRRRDLPHPPATSLAPQGEALRQVERENAKLVQLQRLVKVHQSMCEIKVYLQHTQEAVLSMRLPKDRSLADATEEARLRLLQLDGEQPEVCVKLRQSVCECRMSRLEAFSGSVGETFGGRESLSLEELGLVPVCQLVFEARGEGEEEFAEHDDWTFVVGRWQVGARDQDQQEADVGAEGIPPRWSQVTIRKGQGATVGALRSRAVAVLGMTDASRVALVVCGERGRGCVMLQDDAVSLEASGARRGGEIVVEEMGGTCLALEYYQSLESKADVSFNHPSRPDTSPFTVKADVRWTLKRAKLEMARLLDLDAETLHLRRSARTAQLKDETVTLASVGVSHGSSLFVGEGAPRGEGQVLFKVFLREEGGGVKSLVQVTVDDKDTVAGLKQLLATRLSKMKTPPQGWGGNASLIRVRDKKGMEVGKVLCDDMPLKKALPRLTDGKEIVVQMLSKPETVSPSSILVQVRVWDAETNIVEAPKELMISKTASCGQLRQQILGAMPRVCCDAKDALGQGGTVEDATSQSLTSLELGLAKASAFGPPLDAAGAARLKWNDEVAETKALCEAPWSLRDGSILVVRDERKFASRPSPSVESGKVGQGKLKKRQGVAAQVLGGGVRERGITISVWGEEDGGFAPEQHAQVEDKGSRAEAGSEMDAVPKGVAFDIVL